MRRDPRHSPTCSVSEKTMKLCRRHVRNGCCHLIGKNHTEIVYLPTSRLLQDGIDMSHWQCWSNFRPDRDGGSYQLPTGHSNCPHHVRKCNQNAYIPGNIKVYIYIYIYIQCKFALEYLEYFTNPNLQYKFLLARHSSHSCIQCVSVNSWRVGDPPLRNRLVE